MAGYYTSLSAGRIEQARARGWDAARTAKAEGVSVARVLEVWAAMDAACAEDGPKKPARVPRPVPPCGTRSAYNRHRRLGEPTCEPCRDAVREYVQQWREARAS